VSGGIFKGFYSGIAGNGIVDVIFMAALLLLVVALILGVGSRISAYGGGLLVRLLWSTQVPHTSNPFIDEHIIYLFLLFGLWRARAGRTIGLGKWWSVTKIVKSSPGWSDAPVPLRSSTPMELKYRRRYDDIYGHPVIRTPGNGSDLFFPFHCLRNS